MKSYSIGLAQTWINGFVISRGRENILERPSAGEVLPQRVGVTADVKGFFVKVPWRRRTIPRV